MSDNTVRAEPTEPSPPLLRIVRGDPSPEQIAALVTVLAARSGGGGDAPPEPSAWSTPSYSHTRPLSAGPGAWRLSATDPRNRTRADW